MNYKTLTIILLALALTTNAYQCWNGAQGAKSWWTNNITYGTNITDSCEDRHLVEGAGANQPTNNFTGYWNNSIYFDGNNDYSVLGILHANEVFPLDANWSHSFWMYVNASAAVRQIWLPYGAFEGVDLSVQANDTIRIWIRDSGSDIVACAGAAITEDAWHFVSVRYWTNGTVTIRRNNTDYVSCTNAAVGGAANYNLGTYFWGYTSASFYGMIDEAAAFNYTITPTEETNLYDYNNVTGPVAPTATNITIVNPTNTTYLTTSSTTNFTYNSTAFNTTYCARYNNGVLIANTSISNNSYTQDTLTGLGHNNTYNYTVFCGNSTDNATSSIVFTTINWNVTLNTYTTPVNETTFQRFYLNYSVAAPYQASSGAFYWNGSAFPICSWAIDPVSYRWLYYDCPRTMPIVATNNTNISIYWNYSINFMNGTIFYDTTPVATQSIYQAYYYTGITATTPVLEGEPVTVVGTASNLSNPYATLVVTNWVNSTSGLATYSAGTWTANITAPTITTSPTLVNATSSMSITFDGVTQVRNSTNYTISIYKLALGNCTSGVPFINFTFLDEETQASINATMQGAFTIWNPTRTINYSLNTSWTDAPVDPLCIEPAWATVSVDSFQTYQGTPYPQRAYFLYNATATNATQIINLYLLNTTYAKQIDFTILDDVNNRISDVVIQAQRYYVANNSYVTVAEALSDYYGNAQTYLRATDEYYRFVLLNHSNILNTQTPMIITCPSGSVCPPYPITLRIQYAQLPDYYRTLGHLAYNCSLNITGGLVACTVADTSGVHQHFQLVVNEMLAITWNTSCSTSCFSSGCTLICSVGNLTNKIFRYDLYGHSDPTWLYGELIQGNVTTNVWGLTGIFLSILIILTAFFLGAYNPSVAIAATVFAVALCWMMGILPLGASAITIILGLAVVGLVVIYQSGT